MKEFRNTIADHHIPQQNAAAGVTRQVKIESTSAPGAGSIAHYNAAAVAILNKLKELAPANSKVNFPPRNADLAAMSSQRELLNHPVSFPSKGLSAENSETRKRVRAPKDTHVLSDDILRKRVLKAVMMASSLAKRSDLPLASASASRAKVHPRRS